MKKPIRFFALVLFIILHSGCADSEMVVNTSSLTMTTQLYTASFTTIPITTNINTMPKTVPVTTKDESVEFNTNFIKKYQKGKLSELNQDLEKLSETDMEKVRKLEFRNMQPNKEVPVLEENIFSDSGLVIGISGPIYGGRYLLDIYIGNQDYNLDQGSMYSKKEILDADQKEKYNFVSIVVYPENYLPVEKGNMITFEGYFQGIGGDNILNLMDSKYEIE